MTETFQRERLTPLYSTVPYGIGTTLRFLDNLTIAAEYLKGKFKKGFTFDNNDNEQTSYDLVAIEVTLEF